MFIHYIVILIIVYPAINWLKIYIIVHFRCWKIYNFLTVNSEEIIFYIFSSVSSPYHQMFRNKMRLSAFLFIHVCIIFYFDRRFGTKCGGCHQGISPNDLVRRARDKVFHLKCFTCMVCRKQLSTGEELYVLDENKFICKEDYLASKYSQGKCIWLPFNFLYILNMLHIYSKQ